MAVELKNSISEAIKSFSKDGLFNNSIRFFNALGYNTSRQNPLQNPTYSCFKESFIENNQKAFIETKAKTKVWKEVHLLFQLTQVELISQGLLFDTKQVDKTIIETYLFFTLELAPSNYNRSVYSDITREINKLFPMPVMVLFKNGSLLTLSIINRRLHKREESKDVLEKITLIKDIDITNPHRGHIEILFDLSFQELYNNFQFDSFVALHNAWQRTLDANELNKKFYQELANWYFWAITQVEFPDDIKFSSDSVKDRQIRNSTNIIRLITRLIFTWFLREKGLIPDALFDEKKLKLLINSKEKSDSKFYKAILQNLFFATLNTPMNVDQAGSRKFVNGQHLVHTFYRYQSFFQNPDEALKLFENIPFLNGGLFECLDRKINDNEIIRVDCFSENPKNKNRLLVPDELFFADVKQIDLNDIYQTNNRKYKVRGIINILNSYKFTITENTPIEEEVALDPELLGKVFENLLASYNPETETTARKQTGSFYTPREIVNYMVDESLIAYFNTFLIEKHKDKSEPEDFEGQLRCLLSYTDKEHGFNQEQTKILVEAVDNIKVLDPACGSGAFPMGVLHKLVFVLSKLDNKNTHWRALQKLKAIKETEEAFNFGNRSEREERLKEINDTFENNSDDYGRKLYLIENGIYGIDIQPIAVQIAKLRFFISLIVDQKTNPSLENLGIRPLPNLETKFVAANTLIGLEKDNTNLFTNPEIDKKKAELKQVRHSHFKARTPKTKEKCRQRDKELRSELAKLLVDDHNLQPEAAKIVANWNPYDQNTFSPFFDTEWMFGFNNEFNLIIGNPPFIEARKLEQSFVDYLRKNYVTAGNRVNTFAFFTEKGINVLSKNSVLTFIIHRNAIRSNDYNKLRKFILDKTEILNILSFKIGVFENVTGEMTVLILKKTLPNEEHEIKVAFFNNTISDDQIIYNSIKQQIFNYLPDYRFNIYLNDEIIEILEKIKDDCICLDKISNITQGIIVGDEKKLIAKSKLKPNFRPILRGKNISRYGLSFEDEYVNYHSGTSVLTRGKIPDLFEVSEKILTQHVSSKIIAALDNNRFYYLQTINGIISINPNFPNKFLLGLLNSSLINYFYEYTFNMGAEFTTAVAIENLSQLPIKSSNDTSPYCKIVDYILNNDLPSERIFFQRLIDCMVYELYFPKEIKSAGCEVIKHLSKLPELKTKWSNEQKLQIIKKTYIELSNPENPIGKAMHFMDTIKEVAIIEGKKK